MCSQTHEYWELIPIQKGNYTMEIVKSSGKRGDACDCDSLRDTVAELRGQVSLLREMLVERQASPTSSPAPPTHPSELALMFTPKQHAVMQCLANGMKNTEIAHILQVTESTVKVHLRSIMRKLKVRQRAQIMLRVGALFDLLPEDYQKSSGIPMDWWQDPDGYPEETNLLRHKTR